MYLLDDILTSVFHPRRLGSGRGLKYEAVPIMRKSDDLFSRSLLQVAIGLYKEYI